jgi:hypothetical protein
LLIKIKITHTKRFALMLISESFIVSAFMFIGLSFILSFLFCFVCFLFVYCMKQG